jgi:hypothetical protein
MLQALPGADRPRRVYQRVAFSVSQQPRHPLASCIHTVAMSTQGSLNRTLQVIVRAG